MNPRCANCPNSKQIGPCGDPSSRFMVIGDGAKKWEEKIGVPFAGQAGKEFDFTYLRLAGIRRDDCYLTHMVQCRTQREDQDVRMQDNTIKCCSENHIPGELANWVHNREVSPMLILCGAAASKVAGVALDFDHGFPFHLNEYMGVKVDCYAVAQYHPAAGMKDTKYMIQMLEDWSRLGDWLKDKWEPPAVNKHRSTSYQLLTGDTFWPTINQHKTDLWSMPAVDTESDEGRTWSIQVNPTSGAGYMVLAADKKGMAAVKQWIEAQDGITCHNVEHDLDDLEQVGIIPKSYWDTMKELYGMGHLPQGLKAAVYRTIGYRMKSYMDTVMPHSKRVMSDWLTDALTHVVSKMQKREVHPIGKGCPTCGKNHRKELVKVSAHPAQSVVNRVLTHIEHQSGDYDPWLKPKMEKGVEKYRLIGREWMPELEKAVGRMPRLSIVHVPIEEAVAYGSGDAIWTGELANWLDKERERLQNEEWRIE